ncbi:MAG: cation:proton antiporter [Acidobacteriota bacterium]|jgi:monovalent cation:H+ antiporter-2, CPA2 family
MEHFPILRDLVLVYAVSAIVVYVFHLVRQSPIIGFLVTGVLVGPSGLKLVSDVATVRLLAEMGVMLLLFSIGLEFSIRKLAQVRKVVLISGPTQILVTIAIVVLSLRLAGFDAGFALVAAFLIALSSTAMIVKILLDRDEVDSLHGRVCLGILILQDLAVVPMMVLIPHLGSSQDSWSEILKAVGLAFAILVLIFLGARYAFPRLVRGIVKTRSKELFIIAVLVAFLGIAWVSTEAGFSLALGGFLAGFILSASEYSHQIFSEIRPLRDSLNSLFFVSIGMLVDPSFITGHLGLVLSIIALVILGKFVVTSSAAVLGGLSIPVAIITGLTLAQIGEFSFIILEQAFHFGLIPDDWYQLLITCAVATMILTPLMVASSRRLATSRVIGGFASQGSRQRAIRELDREEPGAADHVIIGGFGVSGRNIALALEAHRIRYLVLELNPGVVKEWKEKGVPIHFGDCTDAQILEHAGICRARVVVLAISDAFALRRAVPLSRSLNPEIMILTRVKRLSEIDELYDLGANEVVPEEFEGSIELLTRILRLFNFPRDLIASEIRRIRETRYDAFRDAHKTIPRLRLSEELDVFTETFAVPQGSPLAGLQIAESNLRRHSGALILGIIRNNVPINNPTAEHEIHPGDSLVLSGTKQQLKVAISLIRGDVPAAAVQSPRR